MELLECLVLRGITSFQQHKVDSKTKFVLQLALQKQGLFLFLHHSTAHDPPRSPSPLSSPALLYPAFAGATQSLVTGVLSGVVGGVNS